MTANDVHLGQISRNMNTFYHNKHFPITINLSTFFMEHTKHYSQPTAALYLKDHGFKPQCRLSLVMLLVLCGINRHTQGWYLKVGHKLFNTLFITQ